MWTPRERWFELEGIRLHALEDGPPDGPLVILLHGFPEWSGAWHEQAPALASAGLHVLAPDQRGYAWSDKPRSTRAYTRDALAGDVIALADACGAKTFGLVGHDWGGGVAWWTALHHGARVERLAVLNAPHPSAFDRVVRQSPRQLARSWYMFAFQVPRVPEWLMARGGMRATFDALARTGRPGTFGAADALRYRDAWAQPGAWTGMINWYRAALRHPVSLPVAPRVQVPTLVLWGEHDRFLVPGLAEASVAYCDDGRLVRFPEATHWLHHEEPSRVNDELVQFFTGQRP